MQTEIVVADSGSKERRKGKRRQNVLSDYYYYLTSFPEASMQGLDYLEAAIIA
jgi:hypothetical protein